eukprot:264118-Chlamydomonas_euryale.AAC.1
MRHASPLVTLFACAVGRGDLPRLPAGFPCALHACGRRRRVVVAALCHVPLPTADVPPAAHPGRRVFVRVPADTKPVAVDRAAQRVERLCAFQPALPAWVNATVGGLGNASVNFNLLFRPGGRL